MFITAFFLFGDETIQSLSLILSQRCFFYRSSVYRPLQLGSCLFRIGRWRRIDSPLFQGSCRVSLASIGGNEMSQTWHRKGSRKSLKKQ